MRERSAFEVFLAFLKLGVTSFGGPIAHIGYFREELVVRRRWIDDAAYADLVALCQFLPGPASSQVGFSLGLWRAGYAGALAAWAGFTLPSALLLVLFASFSSHLDGPVGFSIVHGLKLVAVPIVAQAVWGMARNSCSDVRRGLFAVGAGIAVLLVRGPAAQIAVIALGGALGTLLLGSCPTTGTTGHLPSPVSRRVGIAALALFLLLLAGLPMLRESQAAGSLALFNAFYRSGALVFGGGHVVLPMLREAIVTPGWVTDGDFLAGYGAAQAVPGPLFTFAAYLGAIATPSHGAVAGAVLALIGLFLPGVLILVGTLPFWTALRLRSGARAAMAGINATVVGLLGAALCTPVWTGSVHSVGDVSLAVVGLVLLTAWRVPPLAVVVLTMTGAAALASV